MGPEGSASAMLNAFIQWQEERLARAEDRHRRIEPLAFGPEFLGLDPQTDNSLAAIEQFCQRQWANTSDFFAPTPNRDFQFDGQSLTFITPTEEEFRENRTVHCHVYEASKPGRAVLIIPHWNSDGTEYDLYCKYLARLGITAACMTLPYHGRRCPAGVISGSAMISANLGRTIRTCRQGVLEAATIIEWLAQRGHSHIGLVGVSLGTSLATVVAAHDPRVSALSLVSLASDFGEVIWNCRPTRHIRAALDGAMTCGQLNSALSLFSPIHYVSRLAANGTAVLGISGRQDQVFAPPLTQRLLNAFADAGVRHEHKSLACGHYTLGTFPFNVILGRAIQRFMQHEFDTGGPTSHSLPWPIGGRPGGKERSAA